MKRKMRHQLVIMSQSLVLNTKSVNSLLRIQILKNLRLLILMKVQQRKLLTIVVWHILRNQIVFKVIMILKNGLLKILDFGLARENFVSNIYSDSRVGTSSYKAPELFGVAADNQYPSLADYKVDLWSLGVIILYLFSF